MAEKISIQNSSPPEERERLLRKIQIQFREKDVFLRSFITYRIRKLFEHFKSSVENSHIGNVSLPNRTKVVHKLISVAQGLKKIHSSAKSKHTENESRGACVGESSGKII